MQNNQFQPTNKLILTEDGLKHVYKKEPFLYIKNETDGFVIYEVIPKEAALDMQVARDRYPEEML